MTENYKDSGIVSDTVFEIQNNIRHYPHFVARIAECAYFKAQKRGFAPGRELDDWLEAEQECLQNNHYWEYALKTLKSNPLASTEGAPETPGL